jgi:hypothetical protein
MEFGATYSIGVSAPKFPKQRHTFRASIPKARPPDGENLRVVTEIDCSAWQQWKRRTIVIIVLLICNEPANDVEGKCSEKRLLGGRRSMLDSLYHFGVKSLIK